MKKRSGLFRFGIAGAIATAVHYAVLTGLLEGAAMRSARLPTLSPPYAESPFPIMATVASSYAPERPTAWRRRDSLRPMESSSASTAA